MRRRFIAVAPVFLNLHYHYDKNGNQIYCEREKTKAKNPDTPERTIGFVVEGVTAPGCVTLDMRGVQCLDAPK